MPVGGDDVAAIVVEPVIGSGAIPLSTEFLDATYGVGLHIVSMASD